VRAALSAAFTSLLYVDSGLADAGTAAQLEAFAKTQLDYALGAPAPPHALCRGPLSAGHAEGRRHALRMRAVQQARSVEPRPCLLVCNWDAAANVVHRCHP